MKLTEHIADKLQATVEQRVQSRIAEVRQRALDQVTVAIRDAARAVIAEVLAEAADVLITVDSTTGAVQLATSPAVPVTPPIDLPPPITPVIETPPSSPEPLTEPPIPTVTSQGGVA